MDDQQFNTKTRVFPAQKIATKRCPAAIAHIEGPDSCEFNSQSCVLEDGRTCETREGLIKDQEFKCPNEGCGIDLSYFSGLEGIPEHLFCPICMDWAYDPCSCEKLFRFD